MAFDPLTSIFEVGKTLIDKLLPDPKAKADALLKLEELRQTGDLAHLAAETDLLKGQLEVNKIEAANPLTFISGARPAVIWTCCVAIAVEFVIGPLLAWGCALFNHPIVAPKVDVATLFPLLTTLLGMSALRSWDKSNGSATK